MDIWAKQTPQENRKHTIFLRCYHIFLWNLLNIPEHMFYSRYKWKLWCLCHLCVRLIWANQSFFWLYCMFYDHLSAHSLLAKLGRWGWLMRMRLAWKKSQKTLAASKRLHRNKTRGTGGVDKGTWSQLLPLLGLRTAESAGAWSLRAPSMNNERWQAFNCPVLCGSVPCP